jgi:hypothetical protein
MVFVVTFEGGRERAVSPRRRSIRLSIAIPSSVVSEVPHLREKTAIIGQIGRLAAIHRVEDIYVFRDEPDETRLIRLLLGYIETPQYLRKRLYRRMDALRYVGILPPLRTPHHPLGGKVNDLSIGDFREGIVLEEQENGYLIDIGVTKPAIVSGRAPSVGGRATVQIIEVEPVLRGRFAGRSELKEYWGYEVHSSKGGLMELLSQRDFDLTLGTSKHAPTLRKIEDKILHRFAKVDNILIFFGSPRRGLGEMLPEGRSLDDFFHFSVNTIPLQGSETVRTEEAVGATLAILNYLIP